MPFVLDSMHKTTILSCEQILQVFSSSHIATAIYTSEDLIIEAVTQEMLNFWDKDRSIIGKTFETGIPELKGQPFIKQLQSVWLTGNTVTGTGIPAELPWNGKLQIRYYDYEYRAIKHPSGEVYCILHTATDVTDRVLGLEAQQREREKQEALDREQALNEELAAANEELAASGEEVAAANEELSAINEELHQTQQRLEVLNQELEERVRQRTRELAEREASLNYIIHDAPVAIAVLKGTRLVIESANDFILRIWGKPESIVGKSIYEELPELGEQGFFTLLERVLAIGEAFTGSEVPSVMSNGESSRVIYTNFVFKPLKDETGRTHSILIVASEVTEQVQNRQDIEAAKYRFQSMVTTTPVAMTILKSKALIVEVANQPMLEVWRRSADQVLGKGLVEIFPELKDQPNPDRMRSVFDTGKRVALAETPVILASVDGVLHTHYAKFSYDPIFDQAGKVESILVTVIDITEAVNSRKQLERSQDELQRTTEELAATNEEITATNEELTATNEELHTSNQNISHLNDELKESEARFRIMAEGSDVMIAVGNETGAAVYFNQPWTAMTGRTADELLAFGWVDLMHPDDQPKVMKIFTEAFTEKKPWEWEFRMPDAKGGYLWLLARGTPRFRADGAFAGYISSTIDITSRKLEEQRKNDFIGMVSHELKTPLTSMSAYVQMLLSKAKKADDKFTASTLDRANNQVKKMTAMINGFLNVSRLESGNIHIDKTSFDMADLVRETEEESIATISSHHVVFAPVIKTCVVADRNKIGQVINNFISNAVKYSPGGSTIKVACVTVGNSAQVSVKDEGIGIKAENHAKLFDRFYRVENPEAHTISGFGIGLYLCAEIIHRHEGRIWVESEFKKGSTFYFSIPLEQI